MKLENSYRLHNGTIRLGKEEITKSIKDFDYFTSNYQQIINKGRMLTPMKLNAFQRKVFTTLLPMVRPETRLDRRHNVIILKPRQVGGSTGLTVYNNYVNSLVEGMVHLNTLHTFPVGDTVSKFYKQKLEPLITGIHPDLFPNIERQGGGKDTSILVHYKDIKGKVTRDNYYELISANSKSIRSTSANIWIADEVGHYKKPEQLEDAISPALPDYGFSLVVYLSTFEDQNSSYFLDKIKIAREEPDDWTLIFTPWFEMYPEQFRGNDIDEIELTNYDKEVIIPALIESNLDEQRFGDYIDWYHRKTRSTTHMLKEYPTTLDEVLRYAEDERVFDQEMIGKVEEQVEGGRFYRLSIEAATKHVVATATTNSPIRIFRPPEQGHKYVITVDPITSNSDKSDYFAASVFDKQDNGQVATVLGRNLPIEDWADIVHLLAIFYNRAIICPERNLAQSLYLLIWAKGYYNWYYESDKRRSNREPGIATTVGSKNNMVDALKLLIKNDNIILRDPDTLDQMKAFVVKGKRTGDSRANGKMEAKPGCHDDLVATLWTYAGSLNPNLIVRKEKKSRGWAV